MASAGLAGCGAPAPEPSPATIPVPPLARGLRLTIAPNLPEVRPDDVPEMTRRSAEVLVLEAGRMSLRWSGRVRRESAVSAERRVQWLRARTAAKSGAEPPPPEAPLFEEALVSGTLDFPDFVRSRALLLPGLWPEGRAQMRGSSGLWLGEEALQEVLGAHRARLPFVKGLALRDPAAALLDRAAEMVREHEAESADEWKLLPERGRCRLVVNGVAGEVATVKLASWFGTLEVIPQMENPLVVSVDPAPRSPALLPLFAPARVLRLLLSYRVTALDAPPEAAR